MDGTWQEEGEQRGQRGRGDDVQVSGVGDWLALGLMVKEE